MFRGSLLQKVVIILLIVMLGSAAASIAIYYADGSRSFSWNSGGNNDGVVNGGADASTGSNPEKGSWVRNAKIDEEKQESLAGTEDLSIEDISENINFIPVDNTDTVKAHLYGTYSCSDSTYKPELVSEKNGSRVAIRIRYPKNKLVLNCSFNLKLDVYIPRSYSDRLKVKTVSGDTRIGEMNLKGFDYETVSGKLDIGGMNSGKTSLHSTSGSAKINGSFGSFNFSSISGDLNSDKFEAKDSTVEVTSGDISLKGNPGTVSFKSISGKISLGYDAAPSGDITLETTSGDAWLELPGSSSFNLDFSGTSGEVKCDLPVTVNGSQDDHKFKAVAGNGGGLIKMNSISGNLNIRKNN